MLKLLSPRQGVGLIGTRKIIGDNICKDRLNNDLGIVLDTLRQRVDAPQRENKKARVHV
jgi:hypothetical protein